MGTNIMSRARHQLCSTGGAAEGKASALLHSTGRIAAVAAMGLKGRAGGTSSTLRPLRLATPPTATHCHLSSPHPLREHQAAAGAPGLGRNASSPRCCHTRRSLGQAASCLIRAGVSLLYVRCNACAGAGVARTVRTNLRPHFHILRHVRAPLSTVVTVAVS